MNDLDYVTIRTLRAHVAVLERQLREERRKVCTLALERDLLALRARKLGLSPVLPEVANDMEQAHAL